jgi:hypothetical protein
VHPFANAVDDLVELLGEVGLLRDLAGEGKGGRTISARSAGSSRIALTVCFRRITWSAENARLSQTNTRLPKAIPIGSDLSCELRRPSMSV